MTVLDLYTLAGAAITLLGLYALVVRGHLFWKILAINLMGTGIFLILLSAPPRLTPEAADPVPQAMVLTGIVVAVAATALALGTGLRVIARTGSPFLSGTRRPEDREGEGKPPQ